MKITIETGRIDQGCLLAAIAEVDREIAVRNRVYPQWIRDGKIKEREASLRQAALMIARDGLAAIGQGLLVPRAPSAVEGVDTAAPAAPIPFVPRGAVETASTVKPPAPGSSDADFAALMAKIEPVRKAILAQTKGARGTSGHLPCPACNKATLNYSVAHNGHIAASCTSGTCVGFRE